MSQAVFSRTYGNPSQDVAALGAAPATTQTATASAYLWAIEEFPDQIREAQQASPDAGTRRGRVEGMVR